MTTAAQRVEKSLYDIELAMLEETIADRPDRLLSDTDILAVTDPLLRLELWARYFRQEFLWSDDLGEASPVTFTLLRVRQITEHIEQAVADMSHGYNSFTCPRHFDDCKCEPKDDTTTCNPYHGTCSNPRHAIATPCGDSFEPELRANAAR